MKSFINVFLLCFFAHISLGQNQQEQVSIIPEPVNIIQNSGKFVLPDIVTCEVTGKSELNTSVNFLSQKISQSTGKQFLLLRDKEQGNAVINLNLNTIPDIQLGDEGYQLSVKSDKVYILANKPAGIFYGLQSFIQLLPPEIESDTIVQGVEWATPNVEIVDYPRFGWRGLMIDVSRHFFTKDEVKELINQMVRFKFNLLHMHLTDNQGWRIEIKSLPKLTEVGAWNVKRVGKFGNFSEPTPDEPRDYGGYYTQEDIRELVQYAGDRFVNIMPEIDVPSHSMAAIASYPYLTNTPGADKYQVHSGQPYMTQYFNYAVSPANEEVYTFLDKVLTEIAELFPFEYIHMGGDEAKYHFWEEDMHIQTLMKNKGLKTMKEVQGYFTRRVEKIVASKGKKMIGWDEISEIGSSTSTAIMSWRGEKGGIEAAKAGHKVVMNPRQFTYLNFLQGDPIIEPYGGGSSSLLLNKSYQFNPLPEGISTEFIMGAQADLWTEHIYNFRHLQYMLWPRGLAIAESIWSPLEKKDWNHFFSKVEKHFKRFDQQQIKYSISVFDPIFKTFKDTDNQLKIELNLEVENLSIYYSFDNSFPDQFYSKYTEPLIIPKDAFMLRVVTYRGDRKMGRVITMPISELKRRAGIK